MVDNIREQISSARSQLSEAESNLEEREREQREAEERIQKARSELSSQKSLRASQGIEGLRKRQMAGRRLGETEQVLAQRRAELTQARSQVQAYGGQVSSAEEDYEAVEVARKLYNKGLPPSAASGRAREILKEIYSEKNAAVDKALSGIKDELSSRGVYVVDIKTEEALKKTLSQNLGRVSDAELNEKLNDVISSNQVVTSSGQQVDVSQLRSLVPSTQFTEQISARATLERPTVGESFRGTIRKATGITLPSTKQAFNLFTRGEDYGDPQSRVGFSDILASPVRVSGQLGQIAGGAAEYGSRRAGLPTFTQTISSVNVPQRVTVGGEFVIPEQEVETFSPKTVGTAANVATQSLFFAKVPLAAASVSTTAEGYSTVRNQNLAPEERITGLFTLGTGLVLGGAYLRQPIVKTLPRGRTELLARDIIVRGEKGDVVQFQMTAYTPPQEISVQTRGGSLFFSPEIIQVSKARVDVIKSIPFTVQDGKIISPAIVGTIRKGAKVMYLSQLKGSQSPEFTSEVFKKLPKQEQKLLQQFAEYKTGGVPVSKDNVALILGKDFKYNIGYLESERGAKVRKTASYTEFTFFRKGRTITRASTISFAKPLIVTPEYSVFKTKTYLRDVTFTKGRGFKNLIRGRTLILESGATGDISENITGLKTKSRLKRVSNKTMKVLEQAKAVSAKEVSKRIIGSRRSSLLTSSVKPFSSPTPIISNTQSVSEFAGRGQYERTESSVISNVNFGQRDLSIVKLSTGTSSGQVLRSQQQELLKTIQSPKAVVQQKQPEILKEDIISRSESILKLNQKQQQREILKTPSRQTSREIISNRRPPRRINLILKLKNIISQSKFGKDKIATGSGFDVFTRRRGKIVRIYRNLPEKLALKRGAEFIEGTLRASFFLKPSGAATTIPDIEYNLPSSFTKGKTVKGFVEAPKFRLNRAAEKGEIKLFKRKKAKRRFEWF